MTEHKFKNTPELTAQTFTVLMTQAEIRELQVKLQKDQVEIKVNKKAHKLTNIYPPIKKEDSEEFEVQIRDEPIK